MLLLLRHALRSEWPFIILLLISVVLAAPSCSVKTRRSNPAAAPAAAAAAAPRVANACVLQIKLDCLVGCAHTRLIVMAPIN